MQCDGGAEYVLVRPSLGLLYPGVDALRQQASHSARVLGRGELPVVVDCTTVVSLDFSGAATLVALAEELRGRGQRLVLTGTRAGARAKLVGAGLDADAFCEDDGDLASALQRETEHPSLPLPKQHRADREGALVAGDGDGAVPSATSPLLGAEALCLVDDKGEAKAVPEARPAGT